MKSPYLFFIACGPFVGTMLAGLPAHWRTPEDWAGMSPAKQKATRGICLQIPKSRVGYLPRPPNQDAGSHRSNRVWGSRKLAFHLMAPPNRRRFLASKSYGFWRRREKNSPTPTITLTIDVSFAPTLLGQAKFVHALSVSKPSANSSRMSAATDEFT